MNSSCIEKIKKLFALAQSDNANERDAALAPLASVLKVVETSVSSTNLWVDSVATIVLSPDVRRFPLVFTTKMIWNRSCLGTQFNQWPTRRVV